MGRHHEFDDLKAQRIINAIRVGSSRRCAAKCAGIWPSTLYDWIARGKQGEAPFAAFADRVLQADGEAEQDMSTVVFNAAKDAKNWQAALAWLRTRRPSSWPNVDRQRKDPAAADLTQATDAQLLEAVEAERQLRARKASHG